VEERLVAEDEMRAWGEAFGRSLPAPAVVAVSGGLGAGKTTLIRAIAAGLGVREPVTSPTFALVHRYVGARGSVYHVDAYRLKPKDTPDLGIDDMLREQDAVVLMEWPERLGGGAGAPAFSHRIELEEVDGGARRRLRAR
jgi:tRNA threonylcarbamoyladenosine biosynthesis protein TsaE